MQLEFWLEKTISWYRQWGKWMFVLRAQHYWGFFSVHGPNSLPEYLMQSHRLQWDCTNLLLYLYGTGNTGHLLFFVKIEVSPKIRIEFKKKHWQHFLSQILDFRGYLQKSNCDLLLVEYLADVQLQLFHTKENMSYPRTPAKSQACAAHPRHMGPSKSHQHLQGRGFLHSLCNNGNSEVHRVQAVRPSSGL